MKTLDVSLNGAKEDILNEDQPLLKSRWSENYNQLVPEIFTFIKSGNKEQDFDGVYVSLSKN